MRKIILFSVIICSIACNKNAEDYHAAIGTSGDVNAITANGVQLVFADSSYELTGVAVSKNGRMFTNYPLWNRPHNYDVVEITGLTQSKPYPNGKWNSWQPGEAGFFKWVCVQAVYIDDKDKLWVVDPASPFMKGVYAYSYKLVKIDLASNKIEKIYHFNYVADKNSYINDVRVDTRRNYAYLTNSSEGGIFV